MKTSPSDLGAWIGFSGSRNILNRDIALIERIVGGLPEDSVVVTGACVGVDAFVARAAYERGLFVVTIVPHMRVLVDPEWDKFCDLAEELGPGTDYKTRNIRIVGASDRLVALPEYPENHPRSQRSGSWQTARLAKAAKKPLDVHILRG